MPAPALALVVVTSTASVVATLIVALWRERASAQEGRIALLSGGVLVLWAMVAAVLAYRGGHRGGAL